MDKVDWNDAPEWADQVISNSTTSRKYWANKYKYQNISDITIYEFKDTGGSLCDFDVNEMRPDEWKKGEERMEQVSQSGNEGEHYAELEDFDKQPRYKGDDGLDWIDEFARDNSIGDFRAAMRFTIGKYEKRLGKKDAMSKELYKISDYYKRWSKVEKKIELDGRLNKVKEFMEQEK